LRPARRIRAETFPDVIHDPPRAIMDGPKKPELASSEKLALCHVILIILSHNLPCIIRGYGVVAQRGILLAIIAIGTSDTIPSSAPLQPGQGCSSRHLGGWRIARILERLDDADVLRPSLMRRDVLNLSYCAHSVSSWERAPS
jgi:hypothetical protein